MACCPCRGARVHSDSWGTANIVAYDEFASQFDEFANRYQDFVPVVAAGNFGYKDVDSTVTSPAIAKNCIAVGEHQRHSILSFMLIA